MRKTYPSLAAKNLIGTQPLGNSVGSYIQAKIAPEEFTSIIGDWVAKHFTLKVICKPKSGIVYLQADITKPDGSVTIRSVAVYCNAV